MSILDTLVGKNKLQRQRDEAIDYARDLYNPSIYQPQIEYATERATEGIAQGQESLARQRTVESLFRPTDTSIYGGNQARAIAGQQRRSQQAMSGLANFESNLTRQDLQAQQQGQQQLAQTRTKQNQTEAKREAAIEEAQLQYETELQRRKQQLGQTVGKIAGIGAAFIPGVGPLAASAIGAGAGGIFGGGGGAVSGGLSALSTELQQQQRKQMLDALGGGQQTSAPEAPSIPQVPLQQTEDVILDSGFPSVEELSAEFTAGEQAMEVPFAQQQTQTQPIQQQPDFDVGQYDIRNQQNIAPLFEEMNFGQTQQSQTQPTQQQPLDSLFGEQTYGYASEQIGRYLGPLLQGAFDLTTFGPRAGFNLIDSFIESYPKAQQQFQQEQGVSY